MISIIGWALLTGLHALNLHLYKNKPKGFWYKLSWFFIGWSVLGTIYAISEYV